MKTTKEQLEEMTENALTLYEACKALVDIAQPSHKINVWEVPYTELQKAIRAIALVDAKG